MHKNKVLLILLILVIPLSLAARTLAATSPTLGAVESYSVLAGSEVTNTGTTIVQGNVGVSPGIGALPHVIENGTLTVGPPGVIHDADADAALAQLANTAAFGTLDQVCDVDYGAVTQDLVGLTLVPGVYCAEAFRLTGTLTLSGTTGVWIFKSASDLITSGTANVVGGDPCNVWWRVASSATLGTNTSLIGNILALTSITMATGATLQGRALAQTGAVTMDANSISVPICTIVPRPTQFVPDGGEEVEGLPDAGGGVPIRDDSFPRGLAIMAGFIALGLFLGVRTYRSAKQ